VRTNELGELLAPFSLNRLETDSNLLLKYLGPRGYDAEFSVVREAIQPLLLKPIVNRVAIAIQDI
jgi:hypothetical protein